MLHGSHLPRFLTLTEMKYLYLYVAIHKQYTIVFFTLYAIIKYSLLFLFNENHLEGHHAEELRKVNHPSPVFIHLR